MCEIKISNKVEFQFQSEIQQITPQGTLFAQFFSQMFFSQIYLGVMTIITEEVYEWSYMITYMFTGVTFSFVKLGLL